MLFKGREAEAIQAYEMALDIQHDEPELLNNLAWLLLTSKDLSLRNPIRALRLARDAATIAPKGYVLDTLATAYWANGFLEEAVRLEKQAITEDPANARYYQSKILKFLDQTYEESLVELRQVELAGEKG